MQETVRSANRENGRLSGHDAMRGRTVIANFRKHVSNHDLGGIWRSTADPMHVARALRIPELIPVFPSWPLKGIVMLATSTMSDGSKVRVAAKLLGTVGTSEGRAHTYDSLLYLLCGQPDIHREYRRYLSDELAYLLSEFDGFDSSKQLHALSYLPLPLLRAGKRLGIRSPSVLLERLQPIGKKVCANAVLILAEEGVLDSEFALVSPYIKQDDYDHYRDSANGDSFRETIRILQCAGVKSQAVVAVLHQTWQLAPTRLEQSIKLLAEFGVTDIDTLYKALGQSLWTLNHNVLHFLLAEVGIRDSVALGEFDQLLAQRRPPTLAVVKALLNHAKEPTALAQVQTFLVGTLGVSVAPVQRISHLLSPAYGLSFADLNGCIPYLTCSVENDEKFLGFLQVLLRHGIGRHPGIIQFQKCFVAARSAEEVDKYIRLARKHVSAISDDMLAAFVEQALGVNSTSLLYLLDDSKVAIANDKDLDKTLRLASVSPDVLRYLVQERRMATATLLSRWFYEEGAGVQEYYGSPTYGELERVLFSDASRRKAFFRLKQNMHCVWSAVLQYASVRAPAPNPDWDDEQRAAHFAVLDKYKVEARSKAALLLRRILEKTDGIVLTSALEAALEGRGLDETLNALEPLLDGLLNGRGPTPQMLSPLEAEAVGLVYGVTRHEVESHWPKVHGYEHHLEGVLLDECYPMTWTKKRYSLPLLTQAQVHALSSNFAALASAAARTRQMQSAEDPTFLIRRFRLKPLSDSAAAAPALSDWFALLLYICIGEEAVGSWVEHTLESYEDFLDRPQEAHKRMLALQTFMGTTLPDAFANTLNRSFERLGDPIVAELCSLLGFLSQTQAANSGREQLRCVLQVLSLKVLAVFDKWIATLLQKFDTEKKDLPDTMPVRGIVTKYPAAFYSRYKFGLCTRANTDMWQETRHSHLVVFDEGRRALVGMAMVYIQPIEGYHDGKDCLIIRAINLGSPDNIELEAVTAIDEIMRIAIDIAKKNGYAAVLFPRNSTYFSNQSFVDKASYKASTTSRAPEISARRLAFDYAPGQGALFWCKEKGSNDGAVGQLYAAWTASDPREHGSQRSVENVEWGG